MIQSLSHLSPSLVVLSVPSHRECRSGTPYIGTIPVQHSLQEYKFSSRAVSEVGEVGGALLLQDAHGGVHQQVQAPELLSVGGRRRGRR